MTNKIWHQEDHWRDVLLQERTRSKYEQVLRTVKVKTIPGVGEVRLWVGRLADLAREIGLKGGGSSFLQAFERRGLVVSVNRSNHSRPGIYAFFERRSDAQAFQGNDYSWKVREWLLRTKPDALDPLTDVDDVALPSTTEVSNKLVTDEQKQEAFSDTERFNGPHYTCFSLGHRFTETPGIRTLPSIVGISEALRSVAGLVERVARTNVSVLIVGETGVGKELVAQWLHLKSRRNKRSFVPVNCAAVPEGLFESIFFGHTQGAFTGAEKSEYGLLKTADGGTLFLDEVGDLSLASQAKLLSTFETHSYRPVGLPYVSTSNFRVIAATNKNLSYEMLRGNFRADMFHRLNVFPIHVPPLRDRKEDLPFLVEFFVDTLSLELLRVPPTIDPAVYSFLGDYHWPGNIRELRNVLERTLVVCDSTLTKEDCVLEPSSDDRSFRVVVEGNTSFFLPDPFGPAGLEGAVDAFELKVLRAAMKQHAGVKAQAAAAISLNRTTFVEKYKKLVELAHKNGSS